ncbi:MAG: cytochrome c oxidase subunit II [Haloferacaceae archaeon]
MKTWTRATTLAVAALAVVVAGSVPVAAQGSTSIRLINKLNLKLLYIAVPVTLIVELVLLYTVVKFKNADDAKPTQENRRLEITWTVATAVILLFVGVASYGVLANPDITHPQSAPVAPEDDDVLVHAEAYQWGWAMTYPEEGIKASGFPPKIVIPVDQEVYFTITSRDVIHGFAVPELGLKQDAIPDQNNTIRTVPLEQGTYQGYCTEYCGAGHSQMYFTVEVVSQEEYQSYLAEQRGGSSSGGSANATNSSSVEPVAVPA